MEEDMGLEERLVFFKVREKLKCRKQDTESLFYRNEYVVAGNPRDRGRIFDLSC